MLAIYIPYYVAITLRNNLIEMANTNNVLKFSPKDVTCIKLRQLFGEGIEIIIDYAKYPNKYVPEKYIYQNSLKVNYVGYI